MLQLSQLHHQHNLHCAKCIRGNRDWNRSMISFPSGAPPHNTNSSDLKSYCSGIFPFTKATTNGGATGKCVTLNFSTALSILPNSNRLSPVGTTIVSPNAAARMQYTNPYTWKSGTVTIATTGDGLWRLPANAEATIAIKFRCVRTTPLILPVVPDE